LRKPKKSGRKGSQEKDPVYEKSSERFQSSQWPGPAGREYGKRGEPFRPQREVKHDREPTGSQEPHGRIGSRKDPWPEKRRSRGEESKS